MRRILLVLLVSALVLAFVWALADLPGRISGNIGDITFEAATPVVVLGLLLAFVVLYVCSACSARWSACHVRFARSRHCAGVRLAMQRPPAPCSHWPPVRPVMPAARPAVPAGCSAKPRPRCCWLPPRAALRGASMNPKSAFRALAERKDAAFLGLRGLLLQAVEREDWAEAAALARQAETVQPGAAWLRRERERLAVRAGNWAAALELADGDAPKAALAAAAADAEPDAGQAMRLAKLAWQDDPSLAPAALAYARRLRAAGRESRALATIRQSWSIAPHPDLAEFALAPVDTPLARMPAAQKLTQANPEHAESRLLLARIALQAGLIGEARRHVEAARGAGLNQRRLWLLLAEIDEADGGDQREALRHAASADPDPVWRCTACRTVCAEWHPSCPNCFTVGSLRWTTGSVATPLLQVQPATPLLLP